MGLLSRELDEQLSSASWIRRMFEQADQLRARLGAENVFDFALGNPHLDPPAAFSRRLRELAEHPPPGVHRYMPNAGFPEVRAKIAAFVSREAGRHVPGENIVLTAGAACGLNVVMHSLLDPGDEVVAFAPLFPEYHFYASNAGGRLRIVETTHDFDLDIQALDMALDANVRAVVVNSPNNPTGRVYTDSTIAKLASLLEKHNASRDRPILMISDEPYRRLIFDGVRLPNLFDHYFHVVSVASFSKELGLAGERIGYIAVHPDCYDSARFLAGIVFSLRTLGFVNANALMQLAVCECLDASIDVDAYRRNRDLFCDLLTECGYQVRRPEGAFFLFPRSPIDDDAQFVQALADRAILAVPGRGFGRPGFFRLSYAVPPDVIERSRCGFRDAIAQVASCSRS